MREDQNRWLQERLAADAALTGRSGESPPAGASAAAAAATAWRREKGQRRRETALRHARATEDKSLLLLALLADLRLDAAGPLLLQVHLLTQKGSFPPLSSPAPPYAAHNTSSPSAASALRTCTRRRSRRRFSCARLTAARRMPQANCSSPADAVRLGPAGLAGLGLSAADADWLWRGATESAEDVLRSRARQAADRKRRREYMRAYRAGLKARPPAAAPPPAGRPGEPPRPAGGL